MSNPAHWFWKVFGTVATTIVIFLMVTAYLYLYEKSQPSTDFFEYYGNVTTQNSYTHPERVFSYTFGWSPGPMEIDFINRMWCTPLDNRFGTKDIIDVRHKHFGEYSFTNELPGIVVRSITQQQSLSELGVLDRDTIRKRAEEIEYYKWSMDDIRPLVSSECYISAVVTGYTPIFKLPKIVQFDGNVFIYLVPNVSVEDRFDLE